MRHTSDIRRGRSCASDLTAHLVFVAKRRRRIMTARVLMLLTDSFQRVANDMGFTLRAVNGDRDHVHLQVQYPPKLSVSTMVNILKNVSAHDMRKTAYPEVVRALQGRNFWSPSYYAGSCGGAPLERVAAYIAAQGHRATPSKRS